MSWFNPPRSSSKLACLLNSVLSSRSSLLTGPQVTFPPWSESPHFFFTHSSFYFFRCHLLFLGFLHSSTPQQCYCKAPRVSPSLPFFTDCLLFFRLLFSCGQPVPLPTPHSVSGMFFSRFTSLAQTNPATPLCHTLSE